MTRPLTALAAAAAWEKAWADVERIVVGARRERARTLVDARRYFEWDRLDHPQIRVRDLTCGRWPASCTARSPRGFFCTRRASHTGRHAAGAFGQVLAVWSTSDVPPVVVPGPTVGGAG